MLKSSEIGECSSQPVAELILQPRSLVVFTDDAYSHHSHAIEIDSVEDAVSDLCVNLSSANLTVGDVVAREKTRISLTMRKVAHLCES